MPDFSEVCNVTLTGHGVPVRLLSFGRARRAPGISTGWRTLSETVLVQARGGRYRLELSDGRKHEARSGEGFAVPARVRHRISCPGPATVESRWLHVAVELVPGLDLFSIAGVPALLPETVARRIGRGAMSILRLAGSGEGGVALSVHFQVRKWVLDVVSAVFSLAQAPELPGNIGRVWPALTFGVEARPAVPAMARRCGLSASRFYELFRAAMGSTPNEWLLARRIDKACHLLEHTELSCKEIAGVTGFDDPAYFGRMFRRRTGRTPLGFRRSARSGKPVS